MIDSENRGERPVAAFGNSAHLRALFDGHVEASVLVGDARDHRVDLVPDRARSQVMNDAPARSVGLVASAPRRRLRRRRRTARR